MPATMIVNVVRSISSASTVLLRALLSVPLTVLATLARFCTTGGGWMIRRQRKKKVKDQRGPGLECAAAAAASTSSVPPAIKEEKQTSTSVVSTGKNAAPIPPPDGTDAPVESPKSAPVDPPKGGQDGGETTKKNETEAACLTPADNKTDDKKVTSPAALGTSESSPSLGMTEVSFSLAESSEDSSDSLETTATDDRQTMSECERLYGPYPRSIPVPYIDDKKSDKNKTPPSSILSSAETLWDLTDYPDHRDKGTPDEWIPRDGRLVRLTGRHPFNVEPPLSVLNETRFITPACLHYVRNHGACPDLKWDEHTLKIGGGSPSALVPNPYEMSMDELVAVPEPREFPCTLVCAGNRRKEQNTIRRTVGFNWGPGGASTNVWKGVLLRDLLLRAGVSPKNTAGKHVEFLGVEDLPNKVGPGPFAANEPWGKTVKYGTSVPLSRAMNPAYDIIVAYQANGEVLQPDHGYPVRLVVPGYIGGRMIKWLECINVIPHETRNHYHYHDNRILPPHVSTAEESLRGEWWYRPEYIFNELNINSVVSAPDHDETLSVAENIDTTYEVGGYAYTGGGRKITRVEITADDGATWRLASVERKERPTEYGMHWCWIWWKYDLPVADLIGCKEIWCRAWDESNNPQPLEPTWNLMGMGNNHVFRVKVHMDALADGRHAFRFEHPTQPGQQPGGWMTKAVERPLSAGFGNILEEQAKAEDGGAAAAASPAREPAKNRAAPSGTKVQKGAAIAKKVYTLSEVQKHDKADDVWIVVKDKVYDCTDYLELHPGGIDSILINGGSDATQDFLAIHSVKATKMLEKYYIGDLLVDAGSVKQATENHHQRFDVDGNPIALDPKRKITLALRSKTFLSRDSFLLDFELPSPRHVLGLPTGKHVFLSASIDGETVVRRYTPVSSDHDRGCVKFLVKAYRPCDRFPHGGKMSQHLDSLMTGDTIDVRGPVGEFEYVKNGNFLVEGEKRYASKLNLIAGGTGITPAMQIAAEILRHSPSEDSTRMSLVFACREEGDLLMRSVLDEWSAKFGPDRFRVHYVLSDAWPKDWTYSKGFVSKELFEKYLYPPGNDVHTLMCGPPVMLDKGCTPNLVALGHERDNIFSF